MSPNLRLCITLIPALIFKLRGICGTILLNDVIETSSWFYFL